MLEHIEFVRSGDVRLCLRVAGQGPPLLFLGGTGWDLRMPKTPLSSPLINHFTVALFDQRGQGRSEKPPGPYSMQGYAEDALAVADALAWQAPHLVGYSFGGMVAQEFAIRFPDRLSKLVLAATTPGGSAGSSYPIHELLALSPLDRARRGLEISDRRFHALQASDPGKAQRMIEIRAKAQMRYAGEPGARAGLAAQLAARAQHDCAARQHQIVAPTMVLAGTEDGQAPFDTQRSMAQNLPDAQFNTVPGSHNFIFESDAGYDAITAFLQ